MFYLYTLTASRVAKAYYENGRHVTAGNRDKLMAVATRISAVERGSSFFISAKPNLHDTLDGKPLEHTMGSTGRRLAEKELG
jgi:hypothetical protein